VFKNTQGGKNMNLRTMNFESEQSTNEQFTIINNITRDIFVGDFTAYGTVAPEGLRNGSKAPGKYGADALTLQTLLLNINDDDELPLNALASNDAVYFEVHLDETRYAGIVKDNSDEEKRSLKVEYVGAQLPKEVKMLPFMLWNFRDCLKKGSKPDPHTRQSKQEDIKLLFAFEYRERFLELVKEFQDDGSVTNGNLAIFSDCFDYGFLRYNRSMEAEIEENAPGLLETVRQAVKSKELKPMGIFKNLEVVKFINFDEEDVPAPTGKLSNSEMMKRVREGAYRFEYEWSPDQKVRIPSLSFLETYVPNEHFYTLVNKLVYRFASIDKRKEEGMSGSALIGNDIINAFVVGKPGTGKTTTLYALGAALGLPVYSIPLNKHTESDTFEGMNKFVDGKLQFVPTEFLKAFTEPSIIILEEVNLADPGVVMGALGQAVEFPYVLMKDGYIPVTRNANSAIFGAMNIGTYGSRGVNEAFSSRFKQTYILDDPTREEFIDILSKGGNTIEECEWVYNAYTKIINFLEDPANGGDEELTLNITLRGCKGALEDISEGNDPYQAIKNTLVGKIRQSATAEETNRVWEEVVQNLPPLY
jgi:hypothetical protein